MTCTKKDIKHWIHYKMTVDDPYKPIGSLQTYVLETTLQIWPELQEIANSLYVVYASTAPQFSFVLQSKERLLDEIQTAILSGKTQIIFWNAIEPIVENIVLKCHDLIESLPTEITKLAKFFMITQCLNADESYTQFCQEYGIQRELIQIAAHYSEMNSKMYIGPLQVPLYNIGNRKKKFICFNRTPRVHRIELTDQLLGKDLIKDSYYSFAGDADMWNNPRSRLEKWPNILANLDLMPLNVNLNNDRPNPLDFSQEDLQFHLDCYFSVITETMFQYSTDLHENWNMYPGKFLTEKIYRAIVFKHPFIIVGCPRLLAEVKRSGYKTFHPFINESYDNIVDDQSRMLAIVDEIARLCSFNNSEWIEWQQSIKDIVEHNYCVMLSRTDHRINTNVLDIMKE